MRKRLREKILAERRELRETPFSRRAKPLRRALNPLFTLIAKSHGDDIGVRTASLILQDGRRAAPIEADVGGSRRAASR
jgi:hypothetical protein